NLEPGDDIFHIGLNRAVTLIAEKIAKGPRRRFGADPGRALGMHPTRGGPIAAKNGRYGPYVSHEGVNATLPNDKTPETITLEEAVALIDARTESSGRRAARRHRAVAPSRPPRASRGQNGGPTRPPPAPSKLPPTAQGPPPP